MREMDETALAMNGAGKAVAVWVRVEPDGRRRALVARRFGGDGTAVDDAEQELETLPAGLPGHPCVAIDAQGDFVVSWQHSHEPGVGTSLCVRRYRY
jgi:hypothetical protein